MDPIVTMKLVFPSGQTLEVAVPRSLAQTTRSQANGHAKEIHVNETRMPVEKPASRPDDSGVIYSC